MQENSSTDSGIKCDPPQYDEPNNETATKPSFDDFNDEQNMFDRSSQHDSEDDVASDSNSDSDDDSEDGVASTIINLTLLALELRRWALKCKITHLSLDLLLQIL